MASNDGDLISITNIDRATQGRLKSTELRLRKIITVDHVEQMRRIKLIDEVLKHTERVLNPAAHAGNSPLYKQEVEDALTNIQDLVVSLKS